MSELKRAPLISLDSQRLDDKKPKNSRKTIRISVILPESTEDKYPEYNYKDQLTAAKKKNGPRIIAPPPQTNGVDPFFDDDDDDVRRIAQQMEAKYGTADSTKKKRKWRKDDYADIGMGYDESDSFIDNTDGYDEMIPKNVTTILGGFYINSGELEFKNDEEVSSEESSSSEEEAPAKSAPRKRILVDSSPESEGETDTDKISKESNAEKKLKLENGMHKALQKRLFSHEKIKQLKKKRDEEKKTVRELLREKREDLNMTIPEDLDKTDLEGMSQENRKSGAYASVDYIIESVVCGVKQESIDIKMEDESSKDSSSSKDAGFSKSGNHNLSECDSSDFITTKDVEIVRLPENLPEDIVSIIDNIKQAAAATTEGKVKFFSGPVNKMLLTLERKCRCLGKHSRLKVYEHLAPFVRCRKETLLKRARNLIVGEEDKKLKDCLHRLKGVIGNIIPELVEIYEQELQTVLQKKFSKDSVDNEQIKALRMPKRRFPWSEEAKKLVREAVGLKKKCLILEERHKNPLDVNLIISFIKTDIQTLWPEGWMPLQTLQRVTNVGDVKKPSNAPKSPSQPATDTTKISTINISSNSQNLSHNLSASSSLTITPVTGNLPKTNSNEVKMKPKNILKSDTSVSKINISDSDSISKYAKALPAIEIIKTSPETVSSTKLSHDRQEKVSPSGMTMITYDKEDKRASGSNNKTSFNNEEKKTSSIVSKIVYNKEEFQPTNLTKTDKEDRKISSGLTQVIYDKEDKHAVGSSKAIREKDDKLSGFTKVVYDKESKKTNLPKALSDACEIQSNPPKGASYEKDEKKAPASVPLIDKPRFTKAPYEKDDKKFVNFMSEPILIEDSPIKTEHPQPVTVNREAPVNKKEKSSKTDVNHCQVIDLTDQPEVKRKPGPKSKTKYFEIGDKPPKIKKATSDRDSITGSSAYNQLIADSLSNSNKFAHSTPQSTLPNNTAIAVSGSDTSIKNLSNITAADYGKCKPSSEGDDIQMVLEGLKNLQKMSSPIKMNDFSPASSAVSVIAYNSSPPKSSNLPQSSASIDSPKVPSNAPSFQDAFQKQFIHDFNLMKAAASTKGSHNSNDRQAHSSNKISSSAPSNDKYMQAANNNYAQQNYSKLKNNYAPPQSGTYNMLDDMFANLLSEYGYSKPANHKTNQQQK